MKSFFLMGPAVAVMLATAAVPSQAGCLSGAVVGGVAGHFAGRHTLLGAAAGCAIGHHMAVVKKRQLRMERGY